MKITYRWMCTVLCCMNVNRLWHIQRHSWIEIRLQQIDECHVVLLLSNRMVDHDNSNMAKYWRGINKRVFLWLIQKCDKQLVLWTPKKYLLIRIKDKSERNLPVEIVYLDNHSRLPLVYGLDLYCSTVSGTVARNQPHHMCPTDGDAAALMDPCRTLDVSLGCEVGLVNEFHYGR